MVWWLKCSARVKLNFKHMLPVCMLLISRMTTLFNIIFYHITNINNIIIKQTQTPTVICVLCKFLFLLFLCVSKILFFSTTIIVIYTNARTYFIIIIALGEFVLIHYTDTCSTWNFQVWDKNICINIFSYSMYQNKCKFY